METVNPANPEECRLEYEEAGADVNQRRIPDVVRSLTAMCGTTSCFDHVSPVPLPSVDGIVEILDLSRRILFPGYFQQGLQPVNLEYDLGQAVFQLYHQLNDQITWAVRHDCYRYELECVHCRSQGREKAMAFLESLGDLRIALADDVRAAYEGDPAAGSEDQIIFSYPGLYAVTVYRVAHRLWELGVPLIPRIMTEHAHGRTGIDIHPGAVIGRHFFIDHGTGVVIGETTEIGDRVRLYQGVTLGALSLSRSEVESLRGKKRHPAIEDDVIVYSGATILGGGTVIGARSVIGGNVWLTESVPPDTRVVIEKPDLVFMGRGTRQAPGDAEG